MNTSMPMKQITNFIVDYYTYQNNHTERIMDEEEHLFQRFKSVLPMVIQSESLVISSQLIKIYLHQFMSLVECDYGEQVVYVINDMLYKSMTNGFSSIQEQNDYVSYLTNIFADYEDEYSLPNNMEFIECRQLETMTH